jgi:hypothetical protein
MQRLLARLERTLGRFAIERLMTYIVGGMAVVFVLTFVRPDFVDLLTLDPARALRQPWRFVTYLFIPPDLSIFWILFSLYMTWLIGSNLEHEWGAFKLNVFYLIGMLGTTAAAWITKEPQGNFWLNTSLFLAFATVFPNFEIYIFFLIPIRVKWLGLLTFAGIMLQFIVGDLGTKIAIGVAFGNYLLFFGGWLIGLVRGQKVQMQQAARRASMRSEAPTAKKTDKRACAICGKTQDEGADIRVCSCEKCGTPRELCLEHARNH